MHILAEQVPVRPVVYNEPLCAPADDARFVQRLDGLPELLKMGCLLILGAVLRVRGLRLPQGRKPNSNPAVKSLAVRVGGYRHISHSFGVNIFIIMEASSLK